MLDSATADENIVHILPQKTVIALLLAIRMNVWLFIGAQRLNIVFNLEFTAQKYEINFCSLWHKNKTVLLDIKKIDFEINGYKIDNFDDFIFV